MMSSLCLLVSFSSCNLFMVAWFDDRMASVGGEMTAYYVRYRRLPDQLRADPLLSSMEEWTTLSLGAYPIFPDPETGVLSSLSFPTIAGLEEAVLYEFQVRAATIKGLGSWGTHIVAITAESRTFFFLLPLLPLLLSFLSLSLSIFLSVSAGSSFLFSDVSFLFKTFLPLIDNFLVHTSLSFDFCVVVVHV